MFSSRRRPGPYNANNFTSFSSDSPYIRRSSPIALRQLVVQDLDGNRSPSRQREAFRIPRPSIHVPMDDSSWIPDGRPTYIEEYSPSPRQIRRTPIPERPFYQITPPPIQYQIVPVGFQRLSPVRVYRRMKQKKFWQEKTPGLCATLCSGGYGTFAVLIYLTFTLALPTAKLVLGILYFNDCPVDKNIPLYMIVSGACGLGLILFLLLSSACSFCRSSIIARKSTHKFMICTIALARGMQGLLAIFLFVWFFLGNYWVFRARFRVRPDRPDDKDNYCNPALYWFAFYVLIFTYIYAIFMCAMKFCANFLCCGACDIWKRAFS